MNADEFGDDSMHTFVGNESVEQFDYENQVLDFFTGLRRIVWYVVLTLEIRGNIVSSIAWLRRHVDGDSRSAIHLAALAVNHTWNWVIGSLVVAHCGPTPITFGSCLFHEHITNSVIGVYQPPVLDCGTTFHLDSGGRDLPSALSDNL